MTECSWPWTSPPADLWGLTLSMRLLILQFTSTTLQILWWRLVVAMSISKMLHLLLPGPGSCEGHLLLDLRAGLCLLTVLGVVAINEPGLSLLFLQSKQRLSQVLLLQSDLLGLLLLPEQDGDEVPDFCSSSLPTLACWYSALGEGVLRLSVGAYSALSGGVLRSQWGRVWFSVCCSCSSIGLCSV